jgi:hypothetical protein
MLPTPSTSPQREALVNCTNVTAEPIHNFHKLPTPPLHGLVKRSRPANDGGARLKRLKFTIGESLTGKDDDEDNDVDSDESEVDNTAALCQTPRKRTIFYAKKALAMSRPGVTCRPLLCRSKFCRGIGLSLSLTNRSTYPLTSPSLRILSQDRCVHMLFGQAGFVLDAAICLRIHQWYVPYLGNTSV